MGKSMPVAHPDVTALATAATGAVSAARRYRARSRVEADVSGHRTALHPAPDAYPGLYAHYQRMMARPAVQKTIEIEAAVGYQLPQ